MKSLLNFIIESKGITLPYNFDLYNEGPKNKDFKITKKKIYDMYFKILGFEWTKDKDGKINGAKKTGKQYKPSILLPLPASEITYKKFPNKTNTDNWTQIPELSLYTSAGAWYSDKHVEYNYNEYNRDWNRWLKSLKPYIHGKISCSIIENKDDDKRLEIIINEDKFNKDREEKINQLSDVNLLKQWADEADAKEKEEIKHREQEELRLKQREKELAKIPYDSYIRGYGQGRYEGD